MSTQQQIAQIIETMEQLLQLNKSLTTIARAKTEIIKKGDIDSFQDLQAKEQKHILAIQKINRAREQAVAKLLPETDNPSITDCLQLITAQDREKLSTLKDKLVIVLTELQDQNDLNQLLIEQSLQFINVSVQMLLPQQNEMNYGPPTNKKQSIETKRIFQSEV